MAFGWCQKFKCGGIESRDNIKAMVELGGKFDAGCVTEAPGTPTGGAAVFAPNVWRGDVMIPLSLTDDFEYRQAWGRQGSHDWDKSQISNITIYMGKPGLNAIITGVKTAKDPEGTSPVPLSQWVAMGNDPHSKQYNAWPGVATIVTWAENALGEFM
eukprot:COSAG05_NODE_1072_length_5963_cov_9.550477_2_plen_157_part_00